MKIMIRFARRYFLYLAYFSLVFVVGGVVFEFLLIPALFMISTGSGYQFPTIDRFIFYAKFIVLVAPVCAAVVIILLDRE